ncbi:MAG TPA: hypothetical protein VF307_00820 [Candidatus Nanopelagicaceae bacterium]
MGALSRVLPHRFTLAGYPVVVAAQQFSTAQINTTAFQSRALAPRYMDGHFRHSRIPVRQPDSMKPILKWSLVALSMMIIGGSSSAPLTVANTSFSSKQIQLYIQVVTSNLEQNQGQGSSFGTFSQAKLSCYSVLLGEGERAGNPGLYTWFTCSGIHNPLSASSNPINFSCTGFSSAVWIQPAGNKVQYSAVTNTAQYVALRNAAPEEVQNKLTAAYNIFHQSANEAIVGHAIPATQTLVKPVCF